MPAAIKINSQNHYLWGNNCDGWKLVDRPEISLREERIQPGCAEIAHVHLNSHQIFYVLSGQLNIQLPEENIMAQPGEVIEIPPWLPHLVRNQGNEDLRILLFSAPNTVGDIHPVDENWQIRNMIKTDSKETKKN